jgi:hypothetical protein
MPINFDLKISFNNMEDWKGIWSEAREVNSTKDIQQAMSVPTGFLIGVALIN